MSYEYPKSSIVWPGAILGYLVNCTMTAESVDFASCRQWRDHDYLADNSQGVYGTITFDGKSLAGVFFDAKSERSPYWCPDTYNLNRFFHGMPPHHRSMVEKVLPRDFEVFEKTNVPCVTTAFWDEGAHLTAADPWDVVLAEGARLLRIELIEDPEEALFEWQEDYQMSAEQSDFAYSMFNRKMANLDGTIVMTPAEMERLRSISKDSNEAAIEACREKLAAIGILKP